MPRVTPTPAPAACFLLLAAACFLLLLAAPAAYCGATLPARISRMLRTCLALVHAAAAASPLPHPFITHLASAVARRARESEALVLFYF